jgi:hypothetical protein
LAIISAREIIYSRIILLGLAIIQEHLRVIVLLHYYLNSSQLVNMDALMECVKMNAKLIKTVPKDKYAQIIIA